jgi:hypothetical protein
LGVRRVILSPCVLSAARWPISTFTGQAAHP